MFRQVIFFQVLNKMLPFLYIVLGELLHSHGWSGFPGISKNETTGYREGELFKYRHQMIVWFCNGTNMEKTPCLLFHHQNDSFQNKSTRIKYFDTALANATHMDVKKKALKDYKEMFTNYCNTVQKKIADTICSVSLFREKYTDIF